MIRRIGALVGAGALVLAGVASAAVAGTYPGKTSQHDGSISLKVKNGKRRPRIVRRWHREGLRLQLVRRSPQPQFPVSFKTHMALAKNGTFSGTASPRDQEVFKLTGRVSGGKITGSFTDKVPIGQLTSKGFTCSSGKVKYTATRG